MRLMEKIAFGRSYCFECEKRAVITSMDADMKDAAHIQEERHSCFGTGYPPIELLVIGETAGIMTGLRKVYRNQF